MSPIDSYYAKTLVDCFIEVEPLDNDEFLKVKETLTRMGIPSKKSDNGKPILWQSCHVLHKQGRYYIVHFKQLFQLDGRVKVTKFSEEDRLRTQYISYLLNEWGLVRLKTKIENPPNVNLVILPHSKKDSWFLKAKYDIGVMKG